MKNLILLTALLFLISFSTSTAQTLKGDRLIGGSGSFSAGDQTTSFNLSPSMSWFVIDNVAIGGYISYSYYNYSSGSAHTHSFSLGPAFRYYLTKEGKLRCFTYANFGIYSSFYTYNQEKDSNTTFNAGVGLGLAYFITEQVALEASVGYSLNNAFNIDYEAQHRFALSFGFQIHLNSNKQSAEQ